MTDRQELKRLAERAEKNGHHIYMDGRDSSNWLSNALYVSAATPEAILALIAENEGLHAQHSRDSGELRKLCAARDSARRERDQFKANSERHKMDLECAQMNLSIAVGVKNSQQSELHEAQAENEALRKDAERYRWIRKPGCNILPLIDCMGEDLDKEIDADMGAGGEHS
jgi:hypothetical protein